MKESPPAHHHKDVKKGRSGLSFFGLKTVNAPPRPDRLAQCNTLI